MIKEEAIEILSDMRAEYNIFSDDEEEATRYHALSWAIQALNERTGRWIDAEKAPFDMWYATCSECGKRQTLEYLNYCPNCGLPMETEVGE